MGSTKTWVLLTQSLFSLIGAERMKMGGELTTKKGGDAAADKLAEIFKKRDNLVCGGQDIRQTLTDAKDVSNMRNADWPKVIKIAESYLEKVDGEIPQLSDQADKLTPNWRRRKNLLKYKTL